MRWLCPDCASPVLPILGTDRIMYCTGCEAHRDAAFIRSRQPHGQPGPDGPLWRGIVYCLLILATAVGVVAGIKVLLHVWAGARL